MDGGHDVSASDVVRLYTELALRGIAIWLDGGWGVDALLGAQTRPHADLDIVVEEKDLARLRDWLSRQGFDDAPQPDTRPWNFVLADRCGRKVDVHVIVRDAEGNGIYGPPQNGQLYPAAALVGQGIIDGETVRCLTAEYQIDSHTGYPQRPSDRQDVHALAGRFGLPLPPKYRTPASP